MRCVCVASVLVAIAARAIMGGMLGAAVAPSGPNLQRSERRSGLTKLRSRALVRFELCRIVRTCGCTNSIQKIQIYSVLLYVSQRSTLELANVGDCTLLLVLTLTTEQHWGLVNNTSQH